MAERGVAVDALDYAGGVQLIQACEDFTYNGHPVVALGDLVQGHGDPPHSPLPPMVQGTSWFTINGIPICRQGHIAICGHPTTGRPDFVVIE